MTEIGVYNDNFEPQCNRILKQLEDVSQFKTLATLRS